MNIKLCVLLCAVLIAADVVFFLLHLHSMKTKRDEKGTADEPEQANGVRGQASLCGQSYGAKNLQGEHLDRFLPSELIKLLKRKSYSELKVGDQEYTASVIMAVNTADFSGFVYKKGPEEIFSYINCLMGRLIPIVYESGGMVEGFEGGGFTALYQNEEKRAVAAAVAICETACELQVKRSEYAGVTVGLVYGPLLIGVVGHKERMTVLTLSETKKFADFLRSIGPKYYARLIVTSEFVDLQGNYNCRFLGFIHVRSPETVKKVYDIFDGDDVRVRNIKRKTKMVFEKGVVLFTEKKMQEARQYFIEVLKMDRSDRAAREYLLRCDAGMNGQRQDVFLETY